MCYCVETTYRCSHTRKQPIPPCNLTPDCTRAQDALRVLNTDLRNARIAIRIFHADADAPILRCVVNEIKSDYGSYFGRGSGNGNDVLRSLRQVEGYLGEEIRAEGGRVTERVESEEMCLDGCWEAVVILGREALGRGGR